MGSIRVVARAVVIIAIFCVGILTGDEFARQRMSKAQAKTEAEKPVSNNMDFVCITPHGHTIYAYEYNGTTLYVLTRNSDGYPISITR
jgi:hypothetical protein